MSTSLNMVILIHACNAKLHLHLHSLPILLSIPFMLHACTSYIIYTYPPPPTHILHTVSHKQTLSLTLILLSTSTHSRFHTHTSLSPSCTLTDTHTNTPFSQAHPSLPWVHSLFQWRHLVTQTRIQSLLQSQNGQFNFQTLQVPPLLGQN